MRITFYDRFGKQDMVLEGNSPEQAKRALRLGNAFGVKVTVEADGDDFSRLCTALKREMQGLNESIEDVHTFHAPSECIKLAVHDSQRRVGKLVEDFGFTPESFLAELDRRVSHKFGTTALVPLCGMWLHDLQCTASLYHPHGAHNFKLPDNPAPY